MREPPSHKKVTVRTWIDIITTAHRLGIPSTATIMYGHVETSHHVAAHLRLIRDLQSETGGFTEFVPLRFIHDNTEMYRDGLVKDPPPKGMYDLRMYAATRLLLRGSIDNLQTSWVKINHELAQLSLNAGCNDFGGTLMEKHLARAGPTPASTPRSTDPTSDRGVGRRPVERTTLYRKLEPSEESVTRASATAADHAGGRSGGREVPARAHSLC